VGKSSELPFARAASTRPGDELEFGSISGVFGVHGEVRLHLHHRESTLLADGRDIVLVSPDGERFVARVRSRSGAGRRVLGRFEGVSLSREQAASLRGWRMMVDKSELPPLEEGEFWVWQTIGAEVTVGDAVVGVVRAVHESGPVDVFEVLPTGSRDPVFVPSVREAVCAVAPGRVELTAEAWQEAFA